MYSRLEIIEMILRKVEENQLTSKMYNTVVRNYMKCTDEEIMDSFYKASEGTKLEKIGSQFILKF